jgi:hypothetical protein
MDEETRPFWSFSVEEVSAGVYRARGVDSTGRPVETTGSDPDRLLEECKQAAVRLRDRPTGECPE